MSTKNKKIVYYLAAFLVVLMLVCTCLLGNTFARYVTGVKSDATANVAKWNVTASGELYEATSYTLTTTTGISPKANTNGATNENLTNYTAPTLVAKISVADTTAVNCDITLKVTDTTYTLSSGSLAASGTYDGEDSSSPTSTEVASVLKLNIMYNKNTTDSMSAPSATDSTANANAGWVSLYDGTSDSGSPATYTTSLTTISAGNAEYVYVYAWVTWTTLYETYTTENNNGVNIADALDAWIGTNVTSLSATITAQAVQATQVPAAS